ncbi:glycosyltransferase family 4 protein [soil metagenome]
MPPCEPGRTAYVLKMYPRFSETFILSEILAHEAAGAELEIFSLRPPADGRFHEALAEVRAPVTYLAHHHRRAADLWALLDTASRELPGLGGHLSKLLAADVGDASQAVELALAVRSRGIDHIHAHFASVATTVARLASLLTGVPYTFTAHAKDIFHQDVDPDDLRTKLDGAASAVTVSDFNLAHLAWSLGPAAARTERIYNGVDLARFPYSPADNRPPVIVAVGRLVEKKGFTDLIDACRRLKSDGRRFLCEIIGAGPEEDRLRQQVDRLNLGATVQLRGPLPQSGVRAAVAGATALAAPCVVGTDGNRDGLPTVLLEAMALGTPCVATPVTGIPEVIRSEKTGLLVAEHDSEALAGALARLLDDRRLGARLGAAARALVEEDFDIHRQAARLRRHFTGRSTKSATISVAAVECA